MASYAGTESYMAISVPPWFTISQSVTQRKDAENNTILGYTIIHTISTTYSSSSSCGCVQALDFQRGDIYGDGNRALAKKRKKGK